MYSVELFKTKYNCTNFIMKMQKRTLKPKIWLNLSNTVTAKKSLKVFTCELVKVIISLFQGRMIHSWKSHRHEVHHSFKKKKKYNPKPSTHTYQKNQENKQTNKTPPQIKSYQPIKNTERKKARFRMYWKGSSASSWAHFQRKDQTSP